MKVEVETECTYFN